MLNETAAAVTKETEVTFTLEGCEEGILITAEGEGAQASTPEEGKNALTALLMLSLIHIFYDHIASHTFRVVHKNIHAGLHPGAY